MNDDIKSIRSISGDLIFSFDNLTPTEFEEFIFELLPSIGFVNCNWRKGTGFEASPSDQGRDIECEIVETDKIDGKVTLRKWYVEAKHYKRGVPPDKILGALAWAMANRPDVLVIIASNFFSNPCKDYIENYIKENKPPFEIKMWEIKDLEKIALAQPGLLKKFGISGDYDYIKYINPIHLKYTTTYHFNSIDYFFKIIENMDSTIRDNCLEYAYQAVIDPIMIKSTDRNKLVADCLEPKVNYDNFKTKCYEIHLHKPKWQLVDFIVSTTLGYLFDFGNFTDLDRKKIKLKIAIETFEEIIQDKNQLIELKNKNFPEMTTDELKVTLLKVIKNIKDKLMEIEDQTQEYFRLYNNFCLNVVQKLMMEKIMDNKNKV